MNKPRKMSKNLELIGQLVQMAARNLKPFEIRYLIRMLRELLK